MENLLVSVIVPTRNSASTIGVLIIDSDMELSPEVISACIQVVQKDRSIKGIVIPEESFGEGFWAQCKKLERSFYVGVPWMEACRFYEKAVYEELGGYDENMVSGEDWDLSQRVENNHKTSRIDKFIFHNEGHIDLFSSIKKKYYYASDFGKYTRKSIHTKNLQLQTSILARYRLFLSRPTLLFRDPILGIGMLFMKTSEFFFGGIAYLNNLVKDIFISHGK